MLTSKRLAAAVSVLAIMAVSAGCGASSSKNTINLVAYSTPQKVYAKLLPAFTATTAGKDAKFNESYGASGSQARAVVGGQAADVVEFSRQTDMESLVAAKLVPSDWNANQYNGMVTDSVVTFIVRKGNPLGIKDWSDLIKPGVKIVTPNPLSSGSACWNLMAAYGAMLKEGKTPAQALDFVKVLLQHAVTQPASGSLATAAFVGGQGDVLIGYENEAIEAQQAGDKVDYVTPPDTILIENPIAVTSDAKNPALAHSFLTYLYTDPAQKIFAQLGYRPVVKTDLNTTQFPTPSGLFTIQTLGGWDAVVKQFFDPTNGSITKIEQALGNGTGG